MTKSQSDWKTYRQNFLFRSNRPLWANLMTLAKERRWGFWKWTHAFHRSKFPGSIIRNKHRWDVDVVMAKTALQQQKTNKFQLVLTCICLPMWPLWILTRNQFLQPPPIEFVSSKLVLVICTFGYCRNLKSTIKTQFCSNII